MLDIIFLSLDEPNAEVNWQNLVNRFPHAKRVHGVKGIANAHMEAARRSSTTFFYVVDADAEVLETFKFDYKPTLHEENYVHIWSAFNPAIGLDYGYGGVKLFSKKFFGNVTNQLDFSTTLASGIKLMPEIACITWFNSDPLRAYRGAFRECVKLYGITLDKNRNETERAEARTRLAAWVDPVKCCSFRRYVAQGAMDGISAAKRSPDDLLFINDHSLMCSMFAHNYPELDLQTLPDIKGSPMKHELFFTTRIASALYDPLVLESLPLTELRDAISDGQMLSKVWLVEKLDEMLKDGKITNDSGKVTVAVLGGWIGTLSLLMNAWELPISIVSIDIDARSNRIAEKLNYDCDFKTVTNDMYKIDYSKFDVIINTSSEHIPDIPAWKALIPPGKVLIVQNNNYEDAEGHVSIVDDSTALRDKLKLSEVIYEGTRQFPQYNRFMIIGRT